MTKAKVIKPDPTHIRVKLLEDRNNQEEMVVPKSSSMLIKKFRMESDNAISEYYVVTLLSNAYWKISAEEYERLTLVLSNETIDVKPSKGAVNENT